jgi:hypothetical protein
MASLPTLATHVLAVRRRNDRARERDADQAAETGVLIGRIVLEAKEGAETMRRLTRVLTVATVVITVATLINVVVAIYSVLK